MRDEGEELGNRRGRALQMDKDLSPQMQRGDGRWIETGSLQGYNVTVHGHDFHLGCEGYLTLSFLKQTSVVSNSFAFTFLMSYYPPSCTSQHLCSPTNHSPFLFPQAFKTPLSPDPFPCAVLIKSKIYVSIKSEFELKSVRKYKKRKRDRNEE